MPGYYNIGTRLGYDLANGLQPGQSATATDGSVWTKNQDGSITVMQNGQQKIGQITYQPQGTAAQSGGNSGYSNPYQEQLQTAIADLNSSQWQGWNKDEDESYQAYRKAYLREADRSMQDTLGQYAQNTGGIAGSSAINAASQAADYYKSQLNDKIPELYEAAYGRHLNDLSLKQQNVNMLMQAQSQDASLYYQQLNYAMQKWAQMGYADAEVAGILGVAEGTPTSDQSYTDWSKQFGGSSGSSGYSNSTSDASVPLSQMAYDDLWLMALDSGNPYAWISQHWKEAGFSSQEDMLDAYDLWSQNGGDDPQLIDGKNEDVFIGAITDLIADPTYVGNRSAAFDWINSQAWTAAQKEFARAVWMELTGYTGG